MRLIIKIYPRSEGGDFNENYFYEVTDTEDEDFGQHCYGYSFSPEGSIIQAMLRVLENISDSDDTAADVELKLGDIEFQRRLYSCTWFEDRHNEGKYIIIQYKDEEE